MNPNIMKKKSGWLMPNWFAFFTGFVDFGYWNVLVNAFIVVRWSQEVQSNMFRFFLYWRNYKLNSVFYPTKI